MPQFDLYLSSIDSWIAADTTAGTYRKYNNIEDGPAGINPTVYTFTTEDLAAARAAEPVPPPTVTAITDLKNALATLRAATADHYITPQEAAALETIVIPALETFRDQGEFDADSTYTALLVLAQIVQAVYIVNKMQSAALQQMSSAISAASARLDALEDSVFPE